MPAVTFALLRSPRISRGKPVCRNFFGTYPPEQDFLHGGL
jgi:hypothetical protein